MTLKSSKRSQKKGKETIEWKMAKLIKLVEVALTARNLPATTDYVMWGTYLTVNNNQMNAAQFLQYHFIHPP